MHYCWVAAALQQALFCRQGEGGKGRHDCYAVAQRHGHPGLERSQLVGRWEVEYRLCGSGGGFMMGVRMTVMMAHLQRSSSMSAATSRASRLRVYLRCAPVYCGKQYGLPYLYNTEGG